MDLAIVTLKERPDLEVPFRRLDDAEVPYFLQHGVVPRRYRDESYKIFAEYQVVVCEEPDTVIAVGSANPIFWDGTLAGLPAGWDATLERAIQDYHQSRPVTTMVGMSVTVSRTHQRRGLGRLVLQKINALTAECGFRSLIIPARPILKARYPLTPIERYIGWERSGGLPFDPWLRTHFRLGAKILAAAPRSMTITGTVKEWESWTGLEFPESGSYVIPGGLQPVDIDCERNMGRYDDPNVWVQYTI